MRNRPFVKEAEKIKPIEIYIHIPFCVKKCAYCDFLSAPASEEARGEYVQLLCAEIEDAGRRLRGHSEGTEDGEAYQVSTIFFGGGTPSLLTGEQMEQIMACLFRAFDIREDAEITMEVNPGTVTREKLIRYRKAGVNRLSIGLQSVHDEELRMLGRIHTYAEFTETYRMAREEGFDNVNVDLISAIPGQSAESWEETLKTVLALKPEHISAYSLIIEEGTPFYERYGEDRSGLPGEDEERKMYWSTKRILEEAGMERYEISNYAYPGYECRHNLGYWERVPYLGFGIGAASLFEHARYENPAEVEEYKKNFHGKFRGNKLSREEEMEEFMFLGLRKIRGISKSRFEQEFGIPIRQVYGNQIDKMKGLELMEEADDRIRLTEKGIDVSNAVFVEFLF